MRLILMCLRAGARRSRLLLRAMFLRVFRAHRLLRLFRLSISLPGLRFLTQLRLPLRLYLVLAAR